MTDQNNNDRADLRVALQEALKEAERAWYGGREAGTAYRILDRAIRDALYATPDRADLPIQFIGFLFGEFMRAGFYEAGEEKLAQDTARAIWERWNKKK